MYKDKDKQKEYQRLWIAARRKEWLSTHGPCCICGTWENLEVDHIDRHQKVSHRIWSWAPAKRDAELSKCQVLCSFHHLEKSRREGDQKPATGHGKMQMYRNGCRCGLCKFANASARRRWRVKFKCQYDNDGDGIPRGT